jgi:hypothetical protein
VAYLPLTPLAGPDCLAIWGQVLGIGLAIHDGEPLVCVRSLRERNRAEIRPLAQFRRDRSLYCGPLLSANPHELEQTIDVIVLVKAYPQPSTKYTESVCVAGLRVDTPVPEWVRLHPVQFRLLKRERQFSKYDLIRVLVRRPTSGDTRPESFTPILDTIEKIGHLPSAKGWAKRWPYRAGEGRLNVRAAGASA